MFRTVVLGKWFAALRRIPNREVVRVTMLLALPWNFFVSIIAVRVPVASFHSLSGFSFQHAKPCDGNTCVSNSYGRALGDPS